MVLCALYARVSTGTQDELDQLPMLRSVCRNAGYSIVGEYTDVASGRSKATDRPGFQKLMRDAKANKFDIILVVKLDRVMRSLKQLLDLLTLLDSLQIKLQCADIGIIDTKSTAGKLQMEILGAVAEWECSIISERTRASLAAKKARGVKLGRPRTNDFDIVTAAKLKMSGHNRKQIAEKMGCSIHDLNNRRFELAAAIEELQKQEDDLDA